MSNNIYLKQGLNIPISGVAAQNTKKVVVPDVVAVKPTDFRGLVPKLLVREGDKVLAGTPVLADKMFADICPEDAEMILLPGGLPGATNLDAHEGLSQMILDFAAAEKPLAAICAAPLVLGNLGLLQGKKATCYPGFETYLQGADYTAALVERMVTSSQEKDRVLPWSSHLPLSKSIAVSTR